MEDGKTQTGDEGLNAVQTICGANGRSGKPCRKPAGWGTPHTGYGVCRLHGGSTRNHITRWEATLAADECEKLGIPIEMDPLDSLLCALYEAEGHAQWLRGKLEEEAATGLVSPGPGRDPVNAYYRLWTEERERVTKVAEACLRIGVAERSVKFAESQADLLLAVIRAVLDDPGLALTADQRATADVLVPAKLRLVTE